jgi:hypothetical protein
MMPDKYVALYKYAGDGCVYFLNTENGKLQKICDVNAQSDLPKEVLEYFTAVSDALNTQLGKEL